MLFSTKFTVMESRQYAGTKQAPVNFTHITGYIETKLLVSAENVKIQYFCKKRFNSCVCVLVDNGTMKIQIPIF